MAHSAAVDRTVGNEPVWETVVSAVADATGTDPLSMEPLYGSVDPDALDALFAGNSIDRPAPRVTFTYCGCEVEVSGEGSVRVESIEESTRRGGAA